MPYESATVNPHHASGDTQKDNAWSTEIETHNDDDDDRHTDHGGDQHDDEYALLHSTETDEGRHPGRPLSWGANQRDSYAPPHAPYADDGANALSPGGYEEYRTQSVAPQLELSFESNRPVGELEQPNGSVGQGYSFSR